MIGTCTVLLIAVTIFAVLALLECLRLANQILLLEKQLRQMTAELAKLKRHCP